MLTLKLNSVLLFFWLRNLHFADRIAISAVGTETTFMHLNMHPELEPCTAATPGAKATFMYLNTRG